MWALRLVNHSSRTPDDPALNSGQLRLGQQALQALEISRNLDETQGIRCDHRALGEIRVGDGDEYCRIAALQGKKVETESQDDSQRDENV